MTKKIKIHDGIVVALILTSVAGAWFIDPRCIALAGLTSLIMISSAFTGFCPVHYAVGKLVQD